MKHISKHGKARTLVAEQHPFERDANYITDFLLYKDPLVSDHPPDGLDLGNKTDAEFEPELEDECPWKPNPSDNLESEEECPWRLSPSDNLESEEECQWQHELGQEDKCPWWFDLSVLGAEAPDVIATTAFKSELYVNEVFDLVYLSVCNSELIPTATTITNINNVWLAIDILLPLQEPVKSSLLTQDRIKDMQGAFFEVPA